MATYQSDVCSLTTIAPAKSELGTNTVVGTYTVAANLSANDVIQMVKVPVGAIVQDVKVSASASVAATSTGEVGDGSSTARFIASGAIGSGAASVSNLNVAAGHGYAYTAEDTIDIKFTVQTTPTTGAVLKLSAQYIIP